MLSWRITPHRPNAAAAATIERAERDDLEQQSTEGGWLRAADHLQSLVHSLRKAESPWQDYLRNLKTDGFFQLLQACLDDLHLVYSHGKVGSKTIAATMGQLDLDGQIHHVHFLSDHGLAFVRRLIDKSHVHADVWRTQLAQGHWLRLVLSLRALLRQALPLAAGHQQNIVTAVREPVAVWLSFVFETFWMYAEAPEQLQPELLLELFEQWPWHRWSDQWWSRDLQELSGLDVFASPFPRNKGWTVLENDDYRALVIRLDDIERLGQALGRFYGVDATDVTVQTTNTAEKKEYAAAYRSAKESFRLPADALAAVYNLPYVRHFYTEAEIAAFQARWTS
jgi:hypothetical protein